MLEKNICKSIYCITVDPALREYIEDLLAAVEGVPAPIRAVVQNILDEPILRNVKKRLLKLMLQRPVPPVRQRRLEKRNAILEEFDPIVTKNFRGGPPQFALSNFGTSNLKEYRAVVPDNNRLGGDAMIFLNEMRPDIEAMLQEELMRQHGIKYTLVLTAELEKLTYQLAKCTILIQRQM